MARGVLGILLTSFTGLVSPVVAQTAQCRVEISSPVVTDRVRAEGEVSGTAQIPPGTHLWIFANRRGLALVWPQGGGPARLVDGKWRVLATYGVPRDEGSDFEIRAAVLTAAQNSELLSLVDRAERSGQYPGLRMPPPVEGCPIREVVVTRRS